MDIHNDWRMMGQEKYLKGVRLMRSKWVTLDNTWDHDHCKFCGEKLDASTEALAYCTEDYYYWICETCFNDFKEAFGWELVEKPEDEGNYVWVPVEVPTDKKDGE